ncbi:endonuclease/exonuclease/phosphatase family protein [Fimbriiglobus ruber]|uniref:Endonuclease/exonuclease/phosphatase n=1 Tax=Fimbriiglobus ruber TaxID=1908690 RepID=A0A225D992_9BACT|nr:endonuclease/exonuclease/phosphatase family protein [Fimbriiglobus ruber]OWK35118.1 Endonuclease/exonuclease/phosphatase [Fimbriiglobus ruber]
MPTRVATFNVNNLFDRPRVFQTDGPNGPTLGGVVRDIQELQALLGRDLYDAATKARIVELLTKYQFQSDNPNRWFTINEVRGSLYDVRDGRIEIRPAGRTGWVGTVELVRDVVPSACTDNTGRVIAAVRPHVMCVAEVESRLTLDHFNRAVLRRFGWTFEHTMLIDGNDRRGIDVGLMSRFPIGAMFSHIDDPDPLDNDTGKLFNRDCPEYEVCLPSGRSLWMLCNHLKSKRVQPGGDSFAEGKRTRQANRIAELLQNYDLTHDLVVVAGDMNDTPDSPALRNLLATPNLFDVLSSLKLSGPRWTIRHLRDHEQIDFLLVSQPLWEKLSAVGVERRGMYEPGSFPEIRSREDQASDHACVWAEFDI